MRKSVRASLLQQGRPRLRPEGQRVVDEIAPSTASVSREVKESRRPQPTLSPAPRCTPRERSIPAQSRTTTRTPRRTDRSLSNGRRTSSTLLHLDLLPPSLASPRRHSALAPSHRTPWAAKLSPAPVHPHTNRHCPPDRPRPFPSSCSARLKPRLTSLLALSARLPSPPTSPDTELSK